MNKPSPAGNAPVEILFVPGANPPVAYITNIYEGTLWTATWNAGKKDFDVQQVHDFEAQGAHHVAFTLDGRYAYVQNTLLNLPGMSDGSITVVDMKSQKVIGSMDTLKNACHNLNSMVLLPRWNDPAGH